MADGLGFSAPGESLQRNARSWRLFTDQHGRVFGSQVEVSNGMPIGELVPQGFTPPWQPNMEFAKFPGIHANTFRWAYVEMADRLGGMTTAYYQDAVKFALENNKPEPEVGGPVDRSIRYVLGVPPLSPAIPLSCELGDPWILGIPGASVNKMLKDILEQTAGANSREVLDLIRKQLADRATGSEVPLVPSTPVPVVTKEPERTINDTLPFEIEQVTYPEFLKECKGKKMTLGEIAAAWSEHKKAMAESVGV